MENIGVRFWIISFTVNAEMSEKQDFLMRPYRYKHTKRLKERKNREKVKKKVGARLILPSVLSKTNTLHTTDHIYATRKEE